MVTFIIIELYQSRHDLSKRYLNISILYLSSLTLKRLHSSSNEFIHWFAFGFLLLYGSIINFSDVRFRSFLLSSFSVNLFKISTNALLSSSLVFSKHISSRIISLNCTFPSSSVYVSIISFVSFIQTFLFCVFFLLHF